MGWVWSADHAIWKKELNQRQLASNTLVPWLGILIITA